MLFLITAALAAAPAYYLPDDVAAASKSFMATTDVMAPRYEDINGKVALYSAALPPLELGTALLGNLAPEGFSAWSDTTRRNLTGQIIRIRRFLDKMQEDYATVFGDALERALPTVGAGYSVKECGNTGVMAQFKKSVCEGQSLNEALAAAIDKDPALQSALAEIQTLEWPTLLMEPRSWTTTPLTGSDNYIDLSTLAQKLFGTQLAARQKELEEAIAPLEDRLEARDPEAIKEATAIKNTWRSHLGQDAATWQPLLTDALNRAVKKGAPASVGLCANPKTLGGCTGTDVSSKVIPLLAADRKFTKAVSKL